MAGALLTVVLTTVYLAGVVALLAAWFPTARAWLRQDKQAGVSWWHNPGLTNLPVYGYAVVGLAALKLYEMSGSRRLATSLPTVALLSVVNALIYATVLSVV